MQVNATPMAAKPSSARPACGGGPSKTARRKLELIKQPARKNGSPNSASALPPSRNSSTCGEVCRKGGGAAGGQPFCVPVAMLVRHGGTESTNVLSLAFRDLHVPWR